MVDTFMRRIYSSEVGDSERFVMVVEMDTLECARALSRGETEKNVQILDVPDSSMCTAGEVVDIVRVALSTTDVATGRRTDLVLVVNLFDAVMANKSLPANLAMLKCTPGRKVAYIIDARIAEARAALLRRDFIRTLGPIIVMALPPHVNSQRDPQARDNILHELKVYVKALDARDVANNAGAAALDVGEEDPFVSYEDLGALAVKKKEVPRPEPYADLMSSFALSSSLDLLSLTRDFYALSSMAHDLRLAAIEDFPYATSKTKTSSQVLTRCGLWSNVSREFFAQCARQGASPQEVLKTDPSKLKALKTSKS